MSDIPIGVVVTNPAERGLRRELAAGDELWFGREATGVGHVGQSRSVSRRHGIVTATADGFAITSTGGVLGVTVTDMTTPSQLMIPRGVGPVDVPFAGAAISIDHRIGQPCLVIEVVGCARADLWRQHWGPKERARWQDEQRQAGTQGPWAEARWNLSNGRTYAWFKTLVALCEPALNDEHGKTPTNTMLADRQHLGAGVIERHISEIYRQLGLTGVAANREVAVSIVINQGLVTRPDLSMLPSRGAS